MTRREMLLGSVQLGVGAGLSAFVAKYRMAENTAQETSGVLADDTGLLSSRIPVVPEQPKNYSELAGYSVVKSNQFGMNVWGLSDWDGSFAFVDAMKHARTWSTSDMKGIATVDVNGWPTCDAGTVVYSGMPEHINGTYKLVFTGQGKVSFVYYRSGSITNQVYDASTNTTTADVNFVAPAWKSKTGASVGISITNSQRTPTSPVGSGFTNVRLYRSGYPVDGSVVFTDFYVKAMQIGSVIRTMDWMNTNSNTLVNWSDRNTPLDFQKQIPPYRAKSNNQLLGGAVLDAKPRPVFCSMVALEHHIQLANATGRDLWINVPVIASDDFVTKMAQAIKYGTDGTNPYTSPQTNPVYPPLNPNLNVYVEYANEVWNSAGGFYCFYVVMDLIKYLPTSHPVYAIQPQNNIYYTSYRYTAYRASQISDLFRSVFGDSAMMTRVRPVLMGQKGTENNGTLVWLDVYGATLNPPREVNSYVYGAGGSAYYGVNKMSDMPDAYFVPGNYPDTHTAASFPADAMSAKNYGLQRIAYEGGDGVDNIPVADKLAINADPRMETMTIDMHNLWSADGGDLLVYYTMTGAVDWEFTPDITNLNTPKCNALYSLAGKPRAAVTIGQALPGTMLLGTLPNVQNSGGYTLTKPYGKVIGGIKPGKWMAFPGNTTKAFEAELVVNAEAESDSVIALWVNGVNTGSVTLRQSKNNLAQSSALKVNLPQGLVLIRLQLVRGDLLLHSVNVSATQK